MNVNALDHVNIVTPDLGASAAFYVSLLGLERRNGPPPLTADQAQWLYDGNGRAVIHLNALDCPRFFPRDMSPTPTGALHHVAFDCSDFGQVMARIAEMGLAHEVNAIDEIGFRQIFVTDPHGVLLELNFMGS